jgi:hypothetical protein
MTCYSQTIGIYTKEIRWPWIASSSFDVIIFFVPSGSSLIFENEPMSRRGFRNNKRKIFAYLAKHFVLFAVKNLTAKNARKKPQRTQRNLYWFFTAISGNQ